MDGNFLPRSSLAFAACLPMHAHGQERAILLCQSRTFHRVNRVKPQNLQARPVMSVGDVSLDRYFCSYPSLAHDLKRDKHQILSVRKR